MFNEQIIPPLDTMPRVFRIVSTSCLPMEGGKGVTCRGELYHDKVQLAATFTRSQPDIRLRADLLVSVRWKTPVATIKGAIQISRLVILEIVVIRHGLPSTFTNSRFGLATAVLSKTCCCATPKRVLLMPTLRS